MSISAFLPFVIIAVLVGLIVYLRIKKLTRTHLNRGYPSLADWHIHSSSKVVTLKPNYLYAFLKAYVWFFILIILFSGVVPYFQGKAVKLDDVLPPAVLGSAFLGIFVAVMFTPREITWNEERIKIRALFPGSGDYAWEQLEAYSPFGRSAATFLIKFEGKQAFQIAPFGFRTDEWKAFQSLLRQRFPKKKTWIWIGPMPVRFWKD